MERFTAFQDLLRNSEEGPLKRAREWGATVLLGAFIVFGLLFAESQALSSNFRARPGEIELAVVVAVIACIWSLLVGANWSDMASLAAAGLVLWFIVRLALFGVVERTGATSGEATLLVLVLIGVGIALWMYREQFTSATSWVREQVGRALLKVKARARWQKAAVLLLAIFAGGIFWAATQSWLAFGPVVVVVFVWLASWWLTPPTPEAGTLPPGTGEHEEVTDEVVDLVEEEEAPAALPAIIEPITSPVEEASSDTDEDLDDWVLGV